MSGLVSNLFPLALPTLIPLLPLPQRLRNPTSYRRLLITILTLYALFSFGAAVLRIVTRPTFYDVLGIPRDIAGEDVPKAWKHFARRHHPDRNREEGTEEVFRIGRTAYDTLNDPVRRWAYDRLGPDVVEWTKFCATRREYLLKGVQTSAGFYLVSIAVLAGMKLLGTGAKETSMWRHLILPILFALELTLLLTPTLGPHAAALGYTHPLPLRLLSALLPRLPQHALVLLLRNASTCTAMWLQQVGPLVLGSEGAEAGVESEKTREQRRTEELRLVLRLGALVKSAEVETARIFTAELRHILEPTDLLADPGAALAREMEAVLVDSRLKGHPAVAPLWEQAAEDGWTRKDREEEQEAREAEASEGEFETPAEG